MKPWIISSINELDILNQYPEDGKPWELQARATSKANAALIAAAPEMLEALEFLMDQFCKATPERLNGDQSIALNKAATALNKAKGETV
jgi:methionyl-tRNA synthetase